MANEISLSSRLSASKGGTAVANGTTSFTVDMAGTNMYHANPNITTTAGALTLTPVDQTARYWFWIRNQDSTNEVLLSTDGGTTWPLVVLPGECLGPILIAASQTLWADAQTATCTCEVIAVEV